MGIRISHLSKDRRSIVIPVGDEALNIVYRPGGLTPETEDRLHELTEEQRGGAALVAFLRDLIVSWDLLDDQGKPLPVDETTLRLLPTGFLSMMVQTIVDDMRPNLMSAGTSGAGSLQKDD